MAGYVAGLVGPEQHQADQGRAAFDSSVIVGPRLGNSTPQAAPVNHAGVDLRSPQIFVSHPRLDLTLADAVIGGDAGAQLPGRVAPIAWDGEPGAHSPLVFP